MTEQGTIVAPRQENAPPGRSLAFKLRSSETADSIMMFEETVPTGTKSVFHLHHDSDEVAYVLCGEVTFMIGGKVTVGGVGTCAFIPRGVPHAWKATGTETGRVLFLYTPAKAGGLIEEQQRTGRKFATMSKEELADISIVMAGRSSVRRHFKWVPAQASQLATLPAKPGVLKKCSVSPTLC